MKLQRGGGVLIDLGFEVIKEFGEATVGKLL
jgi:hypothetical protein